MINQKTARIAEFKDRIHQLQVAQSKLAQMDTEINALHAAFSTYAQRFAESSSASLLNNDMSNARVLSPPYEPTDAAFPKPILIIPFGMLTGLLLAIAFVYVREFFDHRFKHPAQITHELGLPVLLVINEQDVMPNNPHKKTGPLIASCIGCAIERAAQRQRSADHAFDQQRRLLWG